MSLSELQDLDVFVAVVDEGSISGASRLLGQPRPTVSRRLARLEGQLDVRLLHRTTREQSLTHAGEILYRRGRHLVAEAAQLRDAVARSDGRPKGRLRVAMPPGLAGDGLSGALVDFMEAYPLVELEVREDAAHLDLVAEGIDVALRAGTVRDPRLIVRRLLRTRLLAVASSDYLAARGTPERPRDLAHHDCVLGFAGSTRPQPSWPLLDGGTVAVSGRVSSNTLFLGIHAARRGIAIALVPSTMVADDITAGSLVPVLEDTVGTHTQVGLVYPEREHLDPNVRAFVDWVAAWVDEHDLPVRVPNSHPRSTSARQR